MSSVCNILRDNNSRAIVDSGLLTISCSVFWKISGYTTEKVEMWKKKTQVVHCAWALILATMLVTSPPRVQGQSYQHHVICEDILQQIDPTGQFDYTLNCFGIDQSQNVQQDSSSYAQFLLCCLGLYGSHPVVHYYINNIDVSLAAYILDNVSTGDQAVLLASYAKNCTASLQPPDYRLTTTDYSHFVANNRQLYACRV